MATAVDGAVAARMKFVELYARDASRLTAEGEFGDARAQTQLAVDDANGALWGVGNGTLQRYIQEKVVDPLNVAGVALAADDPQPDRLRITNALGQAIVGAQFLHRAISQGALDAKGPAVAGAGAPPIT